MIDLHKVQIKSDIYDNSKNKNNYYTLNIDNNPIKKSIENNIDIYQNEENECINIISKEQEQENHIIYFKNKKSKNPNSEKKEKKNSSSKSIKSNDNISEPFDIYKNNEISANHNKNFFDKPDIYIIAKEEESNRLNIVHPIKIEQKEIEKKNKKDEKEYSLIMTFISLLLLIKFPLIGIIFFFYWMIKEHKKRMIMILVILIILMIIFSILIYIYYLK